MIFRVAKFVLAILTFVTMSGFMGLKHHSTNCKDWDELTKEEKQVIESISLKVLENLKNKEIDKLWNSSHSAFRKAVSLSQLSSFSESIIKRLDNIDGAKILDSRVVTFKGSSNHKVVCGSVDTSSDKYLSFWGLDGIKKLVVSVVIIQSKPLERFLTLRFAEEDGLYKLFRFELGINSFKEKDAKYYEVLGDKWTKKDLYLPAVLAYNSALNLSQLGQGVENAQFLRISEKLKSSSETEIFKSEIQKWSSQASDCQIIGIKFIESLFDIAPVINYVSSNKLNPSKTELEVDKMYNYFVNQYPGVGNEFETFLFVAYGEFPKDPKKNYQVYRVPKTF